MIEEKFLRRAPRLALLSLILAAGFQPALAQQSLVGRVLDAVGERPLENARVEAVNPRTPGARSASSGPDGRFALPGIEVGEFEVVISKQGYRSERVSLTVSPRQVMTLEVLLRPSTPEMVEVVVTAPFAILDSGKAQTSIELSPRELDLLPAPYTADIPKMVTQLVAGAIEGHDNFIHLKGNELSLHQFVDGVGFLDNPSSQFNPGFSPRMIESVNIITGGMPAEFGNRLGGVLDIVTKTGPNVAGGSVSLGAGTILGRDTALEYGAGGTKWDAYVFASAFSDGRYLNPPERREIRDLAYGSRAMAKIGYALSDRDRLSLLLTGGGVDMQLPNTAAELAFGRDASRRTRESSLVASWQRVLSANALMKASYYQRYVSDRLVGTSDPLTPFGAGFRRTLTNGAKADVMWHAGGHNIKAGVDVALFSLNEDFTLDPREEIEPRAALAGPGAFPQPVFSSATTPGFSFRARRRGGQGGAYVQDRFSPFRNFTLHLGLRYDRHSVVVTDDLFSPRVGLSYHVPRTGTVVRGVYNRFFVPPPLEWTQLGSKLGTGEIQEAHEEEGVEEEEEFFPGPVRALRQHYFEIGVQQPLHERIVLDVSAYHHQGRNAYENAELSNTSLFVPVTFDRERTFGVDASLRIRPLDKLGLFGVLNYSNLTTRFIGPVSGGLPGEEAEPGQSITPAFDQRHTASATLSYRHARSGFLVGMGMGYGSGTPTELSEEAATRIGGLRLRPFPPRFSGDEGDEGEEEQFVRLPSWWRFDFWVGAPIWRSDKKAVEIQFNAQNIGDRVIAIGKESESRPVQFGGRRRFSGQVRFRF